MVDEDVAEDGQFGVFGGDFARVGAEGGAKAAEGRGGVEFGDFVLGLLGEQFALKVLIVSAGTIALWGIKIRARLTMLLLSSQDSSLSRCTLRPLALQCRSLRSGRYVMIL